MNVVIVISVIVLAFVCSTTFAQENRECSAPGPMCDNCYQVVTCISDEDGFHKLPQQTCPDEQTCLGAQCTSDRNPKCEENLQFPCNNLGVFPDPFDCQAYHFCVKDDSGALLNYETRCNGSYGYHAGTTFCQTKLQNNVCSVNLNEFPVDLCRSSGQTAALSQNPSIYYICAQYNSTLEILYPFLFNCPHGGTYYNYECNPLFKKNFIELMTRF